MLEQFLNNIVPENISHQLKGIWLDFAEQLFFLVTVCRFKFLLNKSRSVLVATEFDDMLVDILSAISLQWSRMVKTDLQLVSFG
jgi:hypothetical protein